MGANQPKIKVCGLTRLEDLQTCVALGVDWVGFNFVAWSSRTITPGVARELWQAGTTALAQPERALSTQAMAVVADFSFAEVCQLTEAFPELAGVQFHGQESREFLATYRARYPRKFLVKAIPVSDLVDVSRTGPSTFPVDVVLFDTARTAENSTLPTASFSTLTFPPKISGGVGRPFPWEWLASCPPELHFGVAGGIGPHNIGELLNWSPHLIDLNSGVEDLPGRKSATKLSAVFQVLKGHPRR